MILFLYLLALCMFGYSTYKLYEIISLFKGLNREEKQLIIDIQEYLKHLAKDVDLQKGLNDLKAVKDYLAFKMEDLNKKIQTNKLLDEKQRFTLMMAVLRAATHIVMVKTINRNNFKTENEVNKEIEETIDIFSLPNVSNNKFELALYGVMFLSNLFILLRYFHPVYMYIRYVF